MNSPVPDLEIDPVDRGEPLGKTFRRLRADLDGSLDDLVTEAPGQGASDLDLRSTEEFVTLMNHEDATVPAVNAHDNVRVALRG
jgi:hypothetical protein